MFNVSTAYFMGLLKFYDYEIELIVIKINTPNEKFYEMTISDKMSMRLFINKFLGKL